MMRRYKLVKNGYILQIGTGSGGEEITEQEYNAILGALNNRPSESLTRRFRLKDDLTWEAYEVDPPDPDPEIDDAEIYEILFGGAE